MNSHLVITYTQIAQNGIGLDLVYGNNLDKHIRGTLPMDASVHC